VKIAFIVVSSIALLACGPTFPSGEDIEQALEDEKASVEGPWGGFALLAQGENTITFRFSLRQLSGGRVEGNGTTKEFNAQNPVPILVTGTFERPMLSLTFSNMIYENRALAGELRDNYGGISVGSSGMRLTGDGYTRTIPVQLSEGGVLPGASLGGRVLNAANGSPVAGATVRVQGRDAITGVSGTFGNDPNFSEGVYTATVSHPEFRSLEKDVQVKPYAWVEFTLQPHTIR
jgi:hypothetical protein